MKENNRVAVSGALLVGNKKSSRLANMANRIKPLMAPHNLDNKEPQWISGLKPETKTALKHAEQLISEKLETTFKGFPSGKQKTFFKIKYGIKEEVIKDMSRNEVFRLLKLETAKINQFRLIANLNENGKTVE